MDHIEIWVQLLTLLVGTVLVLITHQYRRRLGFPFLRPLTVGFVLFNLAVLAGVLSEYVLTNLFQDMALFKASRYLVVADPISGLVFVGVVCAVVWLRLSVRGKQPGWPMWVSAGAAAALLLLQTALALLSDEVNAGPRGVATVNAVVLIGLLIIVLAVLLDLIRIGSGRNESLRPWRLFGAFYLIGCGSVLLSAAANPSYHGLVYSSVQLAFNLFPLVWLRNSLPVMGAAISQSVGADQMDQLCAEYAITARQREVIELLLAGKSNQDIAQTLYIAPHTVKNHIYNLYQKLGISSRYELVSMLLGRRQP